MEVINVITRVGYQTHFQSEVSVPHEYQEMRSKNNIKSHELVEHKN